MGAIAGMARSYTEDSALDGSRASLLLRKAVPAFDDFQKHIRSLRTAPFNEGIFRLSEKPDDWGKTFAFFGAFAKEGRPRGRNKKPARMQKRRWNTQAKAADLQHQSKRKRRPCRRIAGIARSYSGMPSSLLRRGQRQQERPALSGPFY
ncbi:hypothetical protein FEA48_27170 [Pseudomonas nitroreducens]|uniref:Uncharacterized protein n=1 Tax=Pseudomonas nitroreducens TaxID=46680 RepID=A0A5R8ZUN8_PSENT|nr:hypothetical protein [Pseudomonas nitroreducens]TLP69990.1 hypothetical protein FEA48_27170 [Pseudomonas nitroreducens]